MSPTATTAISAQAASMPTSTGDQGRNPAGPLPLDRRHRGGRRLPRLRRSGLYHGPGPGRGRRPGDDV